MDISLVLRSLLCLLALLPLTYLLCLTSSLRECYTSPQDRTRLLRVYSQHALLLELLQYTAVSVAFAPLFPRAASLLDPGRTSSYNEIATESALCSLVLAIPTLATLVVINAIDAWSLPNGWAAMFERMFALTRELLDDCEFSISLSFSCKLSALTAAVETDTRASSVASPSPPTSDNSHAPKPPASTKDVASSDDDFPTTSHAQSEQQAATQRPSSPLKQNVSSVSEGSSATVRQQPPTPLPAVSSNNAAQKAAFDQRTAAPSAPPLPPKDARPRYQRHTSSSESRRVTFKV